MSRSRASRRQIHEMTKLQPPQVAVHAVNPRRRQQQVQVAEPKQKTDNQAKCRYCGDLHPPRQCPGRGKKAQLVINTITLLEYVNKGRTKGPKSRQFRHGLTRQTTHLRTVKIFRRASYTFSHLYWKGGGRKGLDGRNPFWACKRTVQARHWCPCQHPPVRHATSYCAAL